jgi:hypothetical protein
MQLMSTIRPEFTVALVFTGGILSRKLIFGLCALAFLAVIFASREARNAFWAPVRSLPGDTKASRAMTKWRLLVAYAVAAVIVGGSFYDFVADRETWPYSQYPMFSFIDAPPSGRFTILRLYGVTQREPLAEFPLDRNEYLEPYDNSRLQNALDHVISQQQLTAALQDCLRRYDTLRASGVHRGPALQGLRLYRVTWTPNPQVSNLNTPDSRDFVGEVFEKSVERAMK